MYKCILYVGRAQVIYNDATAHAHRNQQFISNERPCYKTRFSVFDFHYSSTDNNTTRHSSLITFPANILFTFYVCVCLRWIPLPFYTVLYTSSRTHNTKFMCVLCAAAVWCAKSGENHSACESYDQRTILIIRCAAIIYFIDVVVVVVSVLILFLFSLVIAFLRYVSVESFVIV